MLQKLCVEIVSHIAVQWLKISNHESLAILNLAIAWQLVENLDDLLHTRPDDRIPGIVYLDGQGGSSADESSQQFGRKCLARGSRADPEPNTPLALVVDGVSQHLTECLEALLIAAHDGEEETHSTVHGGVVVVPLGSA